MVRPLLKLSQISIKGVVGFLFSLSFILSFFREFRIPVAGTLMHPYLLLLFPLAIIGNLKILNQKQGIQLTLFLYAGIFSISQLLSFNIGEILKIFAGVFTFFFFTKVVSKEDDFKLAALGFILGAIYLSFQIIFLAQSGQVSILAGVNALEETGIGNKNSQSQYILPGFFFICFFFFKSLKSNFNETLIWSVAILIVGVGIAFTGNRSGYIGILIVIITLISNFRVNIGSIILVSIFVLASIYLIESFASEILERKFEQTVEGIRGDSHRQDLFFQSLILGLEYPLLGLGLEGLTRELAFRVDPEFQFLDPHNLYGYLLGGGGIFVFFFFFRFLYFDLSKNKLLQKNKK